MKRRRLHGVPDEAATLRPEFTVLSDLSANVFAALLLILVVLLEVRGVASRPVAPPRPLDAAADLGAVPHRALRAGALVALLKDRSGAAPGLSIDLGETGLALTRDRGTAMVPAGDVAAALRTLDPGGPVRLYVFSHRFYGAVTERLRQAGVTAAEISVPRALRGAPKTRGAPSARGGAETDDTWSPDFLRLADAPLSLEAFRDGLARLLAASPAPLVPDGHVAGGREGGPGGDGGGSEPLLSRLLRALGLALGIAALGAGLLVIALTEWLVPSPRLLYRGSMPADDAGR